jgi:SAM-dependent methyltransferase
MTASERWLGALWPSVRAWLPPPPAQVVDLGCGSAGGFVPRLLADGYAAIGIDPEAPSDAHYERAEFERAELPEQLDAVVASTSLHHVADPAQVIDRIVGGLTGGGRLVVVEWASEWFDRRTADWCFARLDPDEESWLQRLRDDSAAAGLEWPEFLRGWIDEDGMHSGDELVGLLDERLERIHLDRGPYFFADLAATSEADEQAAIDAGEINATRIDWVGRRR